MCHVSLLWKALFLEKPLHLQHLYALSLMEEVYKRVKLGYTPGEMITDILYRCPLCGGFDWLTDSRCALCSASIDILSRSEISINNQPRSIAYWYDKVLGFDLPAPAGGIIMKSRRVRLSKEVEKDVYKGFSGVIATQYTRAYADEGILSLKENALLFTGGSQSITIDFGRILGVTIESNTIILISRDHGALFLDFLEESGKKWEDCIRKILIRYFSGNNIVEFYPRIRLENDLRERPSSSKGHKHLHVPVRRWYKRDYSPIFAAVRSIAKPVIKTFFRVDISGTDNIPEHGGAVVLANHTSFLDSIILGVFPARNIWFMAKNSEYKNSLLTWALKRARAFPVRRYTTDVQALRNAIRIVEQGHILGIFPEGERTWDGRLLPFRYGTMRLVLALGKPLIPVGISGAYELMPRWTSSIKRVPVKIRIGKPQHFDHIPIPQKTKRDIEHVSSFIRDH
ncbi:MAG TPA: 1-acyl-sn-glycerol-3-phosphate acyltransferase, partial [Deltaproteobacteria bacterium]|nr:1-acyl-sn-glycerol-3-phosphate acyltransferase [Deltaproteobacteria bacterium]